MKRDSKVAQFPPKATIVVTTLGESRWRNFSKSMLISKLIYQLNHSSRSAIHFRRRAMIVANGMNENDLQNLPVVLLRSSLCTLGSSEVHWLYCPRIHLHILRRKQSCTPLRQLPTDSQKTNFSFMVKRKGTSWFSFWLLHYKPARKCTGM